MKKGVSRYFTQRKGATEHLPVDVEPLGPGLFRVTVDGQPHEVDALTLNHGAISLLVGGESYNVELEDSGNEVAVLVRGQLTRLEVADERTLRMREAAAGFAVEGRQVVTAPMPGKVVKVLVKQGEAVSAGQGLVVIEAMKMENELKSASAGTVVELLVQEGAVVENNAKLLVVE